LSELFGNLGHNRSFSHAGDVGSNATGYHSYQARRSLAYRLLVTDD
jgi:hypothetical protein